MRSYVLTALAVLVFASGVLGDEDPNLRPKIGEKLPGTFHPFNVTGKYKDKFHCLVCEYGLSPVAVVFVREVGIDDSFRTFLDKLDKAVDKYDRANFRSFVVRLTDGVLDDEQRADPATTREVLFKDDDERAVQAKEFPAKVDAEAKLKKVVLTLYSPAGPKNYHLNKDAEVTVVLYHNYKVKAAYGFKKGDTGVLSDKDIATILNKIAEMTAAKK